MSKRRRAEMRYEETGLRITDDAVLSHNASGEILAEYRVHKTPLLRLYAVAIRRGWKDQTAEYEAGKEFGALYRASGLDPWQRAPHSDPTRIVVSGSGKPMDELGGSDRAKMALERIEAFLGPSYAIVEGICGQELSIRDYAWRNQMDRRGVKKRLKAALSRLAEWFRKN